MAYIQQDRGQLFQGADTIGEQISLHEAMARAVLYNMDYKTQQLAAAVAQGQFELARTELLPNLTTDLSYNSRDNQNASSSQSVLSGKQSLEPSTSQEKQRQLANLRFSWNILDFGVSYFHAKQEADRYLISRAGRKKVLNDLLAQTRRAYWQALAAQEIDADLKKALTDVKNHLREIDKGLKVRAYRNPVQALKFKRQLIDSTKNLENIQLVLTQAKLALANLMNVPVENLPKLEAIENVALPTFSDLDTRQLELTALYNSMDLREQMYQTRIAQNETRKSILRLLPGVEFGYSLNYDSNDFLYNNNWQEASLRVTWNLLRLFSIGNVLDNSQVREALANQRRAAMNMTIITRLHVAMHQLRAAERQQGQAETLMLTDRLIAQHTKNRARADSASRIQQLQSRIAALETKLAFYDAQSQTQEYYGNFISALGIMPIDGDELPRDVSKLSEQLREKNADWQRGELPLVDASTQSAL